MSELKRLRTPVFAAEGVPSIEPSTFELIINGTGFNQKLSLPTLQTTFPFKRLNTRLTSVSGWSVRVSWDGILWDDFIHQLPPDTNAQFVLFTSIADYTTCVRLDNLTNSRAMLVWGVDGEALEAEYGGPLRMVIPHLWGYKSCKWLTGITFIKKYQAGYWETRGYSHEGTIEAGETLDVNTQKSRSIPGGEVINF
jgi:DMSO/TMAO reductase YedYZ molybdopterin-dependent catalytic subunit